MSRSSKRFCIALSFPGERRAFVESIATCVSERLGRERVLYDKYYEAEFARPDLDTYLQNLYRDESELIVVFLCSDYAQKEWCGLEWRAVRDLIKKRRPENVMPCRFDATEIAGLFSIDGYVWIADRSPAEIADLILTRLGLLVGDGECTQTTPHTRDPLAAAIPSRSPTVAASRPTHTADGRFGRDAGRLQLDTVWSDSKSSLSTARFVHRLLTTGATGIALFALSPDEARPFREARAELRAVVDFDLAPYYDEVRQALDAEVVRAGLDDAVRGVFARHSVKIVADLTPRNLTPGRVLYRPATIGECATYFERGPTAYLFLPENEALARLLESEVIKWRESEGPDAQFELREYSLQMYLPANGFNVATSWNDLEADTVEASVYAELATATERGLVVSGSVRGRTTAVAGPTPAEWIHARHPEISFVSDEHGDLRVFGALHRTWDEVRGKGADDAAEYLAQREAESRRGIALFGWQVPRVLAGIAAPGILLAIVLYLLGHVLHLMRLKESDPGPFTKAARVFPWAALDTYPLGAIFTWFSIVALPSAVSATLVARSFDSEPSSSMLGGLATACLCAFGVRTALRIDGLRRSLAVEPATTPAAHAE